MWNKVGITGEDEEDGWSKRWTCIQKSQGKGSAAGLRKRKEAVWLVHRVKERADGAGQFTQGFGGLVKEFAFYSKSKGR